MEKKKKFLSNLLFLSRKQTEVKCFKRNLEIDNEQQNEQMNYRNTDYNIEAEL